MGAGAQHSSCYKKYGIFPVDAQKKKNNASTAHESKRRRHERREPSDGVIVEEHGNPDRDEKNCLKQKEPLVSPRHQIAAIAKQLENNEDENLRKCHDGERPTKLFSE